jgi:hypothetical protein
MWGLRSNLKVRGWRVEEVENELFFWSFERSYFRFFTVFIIFKLFDILISDFWEVSGG